MTKNSLLALKSCIRVNFTLLLFLGQVFLAPVPFIRKRNVSNFKFIAHIGNYGTGNSLAYYIGITPTKSTYFFYQRTPQSHAFFYPTTDLVIELTDNDSANQIDRIDFSTKVTEGFILVSGSVFTFFRFDFTIQMKPRKDYWLDFKSELANPTPAIRNVSQFEDSKVFILVDFEAWVFNMSDLTSTRLMLQTNGLPEELFYLDCMYGVAWVFWINNQTDCLLKYENLASNQRLSHTITSDGDYLNQNPGFGVQKILGMKSTDITICLIVEESDIKMWALFLGFDTATGQISQKFKSPLVKFSLTDWYSVEHFWSYRKRNFLVQSGDNFMSIYLYRIHELGGGITFDHSKQIYAVNRKFEGKVNAVVRKDQDVNDSNTQIMIYGDSGILITNNLGPVSTGLLYFYLTNRIVKKPEPMFEKRLNQIVVVFGGWCFFDGGAKEDTYDFDYCAYHPNYRNYTFFGAPDYDAKTQVFAIRDDSMYILGRGSDSQNTIENPITLVYGWPTPNLNSGVPSSCGHIPYYTPVYFTKYESDDDTGVNCFFKISTQASKNCFKTGALRRKSSNYFWHRFGSFGGNMSTPLLMLCSFGPVNFVYDRLLVCIRQLQTIKLDDFISDYKVMREGDVFSFENSLNPDTKLISGMGTPVLDFVVVCVVDTTSPGHGKTLLLRTNDGTFKLDIAYEFADTSIDENTSVYSFTTSNGQFNYLVAGKKDFLLDEVLNLISSMKVDINQENNYLANYIEGNKFRSLIYDDLSIAHVREGVFGIECHRSCSRCSGPSATECLDCHAWSLLQPTNRCQVVPCNPECLTCTWFGRQNCITCSAPAVLSPELACCHPNCKSCSGPGETQCTDCQAPASIRPDGRCCHPDCVTCSGVGLARTQCESCLAPLVLRTPDNTCCHDSCLSCSGPLETQCLTCDTNIRRFDNNRCCSNECATCSGPSRTDCESCMIGFTHRPPQKTCCHWSCLTCTGQAINQCLTCELWSGQMSGNICCHQGCATCHGPQPIQCDSCIGSTLHLAPGNRCCHNTCENCTSILENACSACTAPLILDIIDSRCKPPIVCHGNCATCSDVTINGCLTCPAGLVSNTANHCCSPSCLTCTGPLESNCFSCDASRRLANNRCCNLECGTCSGILRTNCDSCIPPTVLRAGNTCCHNSCDTCQNTTITGCLTCNPGFTVVGGACVACNIACSTCNGVNSNNCLTCNSPLGYTAHPNTPSLCQICHSSCLTCFSPNNSSDCASCLAPLTLSALKTCFFNCPVFTFKTSPVDPLSQVCTPCHYSCQFCTGTTALDCTSCPNGSPLNSPVPATVYTSFGSISNNYSQKGSCTVPCSSGTYYSTATSQCEACPVSCQLCSSPTTCLTCKQQFELVDVTVPSFQKLCLAWCSSNEFRAVDGSCQLCFAGCFTCVGLGFQSCSGGSCKSGYSRTILNQANPSLVSCSQICTAGTFPSSTGGCNSCNSQCLTCRAGGTNDCLSCRTNELHSQISGQNYGSCRCPIENGFYINGQSCLPCNQACSACSGPNSNQCSSCRPNILAIQLQSSINCISSCPLTNQYYDPILKSCQHCPPNCPTCLSLTSCSSCTPGLFLHLSQCLSVCPDGFASSDGRNCIRCQDLNCKRCTQNSPGLCESCISGWALRSGSCQNTCPDGQILVADESLCRPCSTSCRQCFLKDLALPYSLDNLVCSKCSDGQILSNGVCSQDCPKGTQKVVSSTGSVTCIVLTCSELCETCLSTTRCLKCREVDPNNSQIGLLQTFDGECVRCTAQFGLETNLIQANNTVAIIGCSEICGDKFWYHKSQNLKKNDPEKIGGLILLSSIECEDGNRANGDGCSSECKIEDKYSCRPEENSSVPVKCVASTKTEFKKEKGKNNPLKFILKFTRIVTLTKENFDLKYSLRCSSKDLSKVIAPRLDFKLTETSPQDFSLEISSAQFSEDVDGVLEIVLVDGANSSSRILQATNTGGKILDSEGMEVNLVGLKQDFNFNKKQFESQQNVEQISGTLDKVSGNTFSQVLVIGLSMNPIMFSFTANVMQRLVYYRALRTDIPQNLDGFFKITGSGWSIRSGDTDYQKKNEAQDNRGFLDKLFGIEKDDQDPPFKFQQMKLTDIYLKSSLPIFLINFLIYILALLIIAINKCIKNSEVERIKEVAAMNADEGMANLQMSKCKYTLSKTFQAAELHFRWNGLIRGNLLVYQNFTLGLFLNIIKGWEPDARPLLKISYILSWLSLVLVFFNGYIFYHVVERYTKLKSKTTPLAKESSAIIQPIKIKSNRHRSEQGPVEPQKLSKSNQRNNRKSTRDKTSDIEESALDLKQHSGFSKAPKSGTTPVTVTTKRSKEQSQRSQNSIRRSEGPIASKLRKQAEEKFEVSRSKKQEKPSLAKPNTSDSTKLAAKPTTDPATTSLTGDDIKEKIKLLEEQKKLLVFPETLSVFEPLNTKYFYSRHYYLFRYIINPTIFSASVCIFYNVPWIPFLLIQGAICIDFVFAWRKLLFTLDIDNKALVVENALFFVVSLFFGIFLVMNQNSVENSFLGWMTIIVVIIALLSVVFFKIKGRRVLQRREKNDSNLKP